jgi:hypothetical protein
MHKRQLQQPHPTLFCAKNKPVDVFESILRQYRPTTAPILVASGEERWQTRQSLERFRQPISITTIGR